MCVNSMLSAFFSFFFLHFIAFHAYYVELRLQRTRKVLISAGFIYQVDNSEIEFTRSIGILFVGDYIHIVGC